MREAVYERARAALGRQLTAVEPPLSTREIEAQHQELEDAIARLEADYAPTDPGEPPAGALEPDDRYTNFQDPLGASPAVSALVRDDAGERAYDDEEEADDRDDFADTRRGSRLPLILAVLAAVAVLGLAGFGYAQRETLLTTLGFSGAGEAEDDPPIQVVTPVPRSIDQPTGPAEDAGPDKRLDRLTNGPDTPEEPDPALSEPPQVATLPADEPSGDDPLGDLAAGEAPISPDDAAVPDEAAAPGAEPVPPQPAPPPGQQAAAQPGGGSLVAQRAIYYFQGTEGQPGRAAEGNVTWTQITRDNAPAVQATLRLNDQEVVTTVTVYKNSDANLPASHLVEVQFQGALGPSPVQRVPALVLKQTEQARGQPLTGAAVPVTADLFWIALADDPDQAARNLRLLREGSWFDIPILFNDGTRALLTFEKGIPGDRIFETVLAAWTPT